MIMIPCFLFIILIFVVTVLAIIMFRSIYKHIRTVRYSNFEVIVCRDVAEIYCNTVSYLNELCAINKHVRTSLERFLSSVSINGKIETDQLRKIEDEVVRKEREIEEMSKSLNLFNFNTSDDGKLILQKHNLSVAEVVSAEKCVLQSMQNLKGNFASLMEQLRNNQNNLWGIHYALACMKCFQFECNALYYGALEGMCSFPNDSLTIYYEAAPRWGNMPHGVTLNSFDKKHFRMYQEIEFQKSQQCLDLASKMINDVENDVDSLIKGIKRHDVNFFIAGSKELQQERDVFASVISILQSKWRPLGLDINSYTYQNFPKDVTIDGHQQQYNNFIARHVDVSVFILNGKAGKFTMEEFDVAFNSFKENGTPKIFVYSLNDGICESDSFIHKKMKEEKQYWIEYKSVEVLRLLIELDLTNYLLEEYSKMVTALG